MSRDPRSQTPDPRPQTRDPNNRRVPDDEGPTVIAENPDRPPFASEDQFGPPVSVEITEDRAAHHAHPGQHIGIVPVDLPPAVVPPIQPRGGRIRGTAGGDPPPAKQQPQHPPPPPTPR